MGKLAEMNEKLLAQTRAELTDKDARIQDLLKKLEATESGIADLEAKSANAVAAGGVGGGMQGDVEELMAEKESL